MPSVVLHPPERVCDAASPHDSALPSLLWTPAGIAIIEIQGSLHVAAQPSDESDDLDLAPIPVGRLVFPLHNPNSTTFDENDTAWMKKVYLYISKHQRLTGEVKKLGKPLAVIAKKAAGESYEGEIDSESTEEQQEELQILEIVKYKILFSSRPEPVGAM